MGMKDGNIAKAGDPFWSLYKPREIDAVDDPRQPIPSPAAEDGPDLGIVKHLLQLGKTLVVSTGEIIVGSAADRIADPDAITPGLQGLDAGRRPFTRHIARRTDKGNGISGL